MLLRINARCPRTTSKPGSQVEKGSSHYVTYGALPIWDRGTTSVESSSLDVPGSNWQVGSEHARCKPAREHRQTAGSFLRTPDPSWTDRQQKIAQSSPNLPYWIRHGIGWHMMALAILELRQSRASTKLPHPGTGSLRKA